MGCVPWTEQTAIHHVISSAGLSIPHYTLALPLLLPGEEGVLRLAFTAPKRQCVVESIWHFYDGKEKFGPPIKFKFIVRKQPDVIILKNQDGGKAKPDVELVDFNSQGEGTELKEIGNSSEGQEMTEFKTKSKPVTPEKDLIITISDKNENNLEEVPINGDDESEREEDKFDLLSSEIDSLTISDGTRYDYFLNNYYSVFKGIG